MSSARILAPKHLPPGIFNACHQTQAEGLPIFYQRHDFRFERAWTNVYSNWRDASVVGRNRLSHAG